MSIKFTCDKYEGKNRVVINGTATGVLFSPTYTARIGQPPYSIEAAVADSTKGEIENLLDRPLTSEETGALNTLVLSNITMLSSSNLLRRFEVTGRYSGMDYAVTEISGNRTGRWCEWSDVQPLIAALEENHVKELEALKLEVEALKMKDDLYDRITSDESAEAASNLFSASDEELGGEEVVSITCSPHPERVGKYQVYVGIVNTQIVFSADWDSNERSCFEIMEAVKGELRQHLCRVLTPRESQEVCIMMNGHLTASPRKKESTLKEKIAQWYYIETLPPTEGGERCRLYLHAYKSSDHGAYNSTLSVKYGDDLGDAYESLHLLMKDRATFEYKISDYNLMERPDGTYRIMIADEAYDPSTEDG